jgi:hypothetical protein
LLESSFFAAFLQLYMDDKAAAAVKSISVDSLRVTCNVADACCFVLRDETSDKLYTNEAGLQRDSVKLRPSIPILQIITDGV